jgi:hypothetical protein
MRTLAAIVLSVVLLLTGCSSGGSSASTRGPLRPAHVMVVVFENQDAGAIIGSPDAPYLTGLARSGLNLTNAHGVTHPSELDYLALFSGATHGVTDDPCPLRLSGDNLAAQLRAAGLSFVGYSEGLPRAGYTGCDVGRYAYRHNPWVAFPDLPPSMNQPLSAMPSNYADLPTVSFVIPDVCHDMEDCNVATGDAWARHFLQPYVAWAHAHNSLLVVTFDEDSGNTPANHIATFIVGAGVPPTISDQRVDHYSLLRTLELLYDLPLLGAAAFATPITALPPR